MATKYKIPKGKDVPLNYIIGRDYRASSYLGKEKDLIIPSGVKKIGYGLFLGYKKALSVTIPEGVEVIGARAFEGCKKLSQIIFPSTIKEVGANAFLGCEKLPTIEYGDVLYLGSTSNPFLIAFKAAKTYCESYTLHPETKIIYCECFKKCEKLKNMVIPDKVTDIGLGAFRYCFELEKIKIPDGVQIIGQNAFESCRKLTSVVIPSTVKAIEERAFSSCFDIASLTIADGVEKIHKMAFYFLAKIETLKLPKSINYLGYEAFNNCEKLKELHITDLAAWCNIEMYTTLGNPLVCAHNLYLNGKLVTRLEIPDGVEEIKNFVFYSCHLITEVIIPSSVKRIGCEAFSDCKNLKTITFADKSGWKVKHTMLSSVNEDIDLSNPQANVAKIFAFDSHHFLSKE